MCAIHRTLSLCLWVRLHVRTPMSTRRHGLFGNHRGPSRTHQSGRLHRSCVDRVSRASWSVSRVERGIDAEGIPRSPHVQAAPSTCGKKPRGHARLWGKTAADCPLPLEHTHCTTLVQCRKEEHSERSYAMEHM